MHQSLKDLSFLVQARTYGQVKAFIEVKLNLLNKTKDIINPPRIIEVTQVNKSGISVVRFNQNMTNFTIATYNKSKEVNFTDILNWTNPFNFSVESINDIRQLAFYPDLPAKKKSSFGFNWTVLEINQRNIYVQFSFRNYSQIFGDEEIVNELVLRVNDTLTSAETNLTLNKTREEYRLKLPIIIDKEAVKAYEKAASVIGKTMTFSCCSHFCLAQVTQYSLQLLYSSLRVF